MGYTLDRVQIRGRANNGSNLFLIIDLLFIYVFMLVSLMEHVQKKGEEMPASEQELTQLPESASLQPNVAG